MFNHSLKYHLPRHAESRSFRGEDLTIEQKGGSVGFVGNVGFVIQF